MELQTTQNPGTATRILRMMRTGISACLLTLVAAQANAGVTIPDAPLQANAGVPANVWFILDDSGSMAEAQMPDNLPATSAPNIAAQAFTRNTIYYNPSVTYRPWRRADGTFMPDATYTAVSNNATHLTGSTDLSAANRIFYVPLPAGDPDNGRQYARYRFKTDGTADVCLWLLLGGYDNLGCLPALTFVWPALKPTDPVINRTLAEEKQNFANWYHYHRTRTKAAKAGASNAFNEIGTDIRVGFTTIWDRNTYRIPVGSNNGLFADVGASTNRTDWFNRLFDAGASGTTPLKRAIDRAGQYFSESGATSPYGPQTGFDQISCRQNFAILTTDGYSNENAYPLADYDGTPAGPITGPNSRTYTYTPGLPYRDGVGGGTLADWAMRYWVTDLRTDLDNNVPSSVQDEAFWQHMVTFGLAIGLKGNLDPKTDLSNIMDGIKQWPNPPLNNHITALDDFWHATINGRGDFVTASNPQEFTDGLKGALAAILGRTRSNANVAVTSTRITGGTRVFEPSYDTALWTGEIKAYPVTSAGVGTTPAWAASAGIPNHLLRNIYTFNGTSGMAFSWINLLATQQASLGSLPVFDYIRGDSSLEKRNLGTYRDRTTLLGDVINSSPVYDNDTSTIYVGANDGMLHAIDASDGDERFAYVPSGVDFDDLATLADPNYAHKYFVDGEIAISQTTQTPGKRILVGLLGRGGKPGSKTVYALDVTDPTNFNSSKVLWEYGDADLVHALGKPLIAKLNNGRTGVIISNGYNSSTDRAVMYVLDIETGAELAKIDTGAGSVANPNGLASPRGWDQDRNGTVDYVYAGDLLGNVWKFDLSSSNPNQWNNTANRSVLFVARDAANNLQPITGGMSIGLHPTTFKRWVFFGTGRYLSAADPSSRSVQSWYGLLDDGTAIASRSSLKERKIVAQTGTGRIVRSFEPGTPADMAGKRGWYVDLLTPPNPPGTAEGERMVSDTILFGGVLLASSIIPTSAICDADVRGFVNAIDPFNGTALSSAYFDINNDGKVDDRDVISTPYGDLAGGSIDLGGGFTTNPVVIENVLVAGGLVRSIGVANPNYAGRISWRELIRNE